LHLTSATGLHAIILVFAVRHGEARGNEADEAWIEDVPATTWNSGCVSVRNNVVRGYVGRTLIAIKVDAKLDLVAR
jgi:hypothetical protein